MCDYLTLQEGTCNINKEKCPFIYYCNKIQGYKELKAMPENCKVKQNFSIPKGFYKVCFERRHRLYIQIEDGIIILKNPYDYTPFFVKVYKAKNGMWKIKEAK